MGRRRSHNIILIAAAIVVGACVVGYGAVIVWIDIHQRDYLYFPGHMHATPAQVGLTEYQPVQIRTRDGVTLQGWWRPPPEKTGGVVLYLHGNGSDLTDRSHRFRDLASEGFGVLAIDWRGYGASTGHPSEDGLNEDARASYEWIRAQASNSKIALFGESLGSGVAITLATRRPVAGVVLDSAYASMLRLAESHIDFAPVSWIMKDTYRSETRVAKINAPLLSVHCDRDEVIPLAEGKRLFAAAAQPKEMVLLTGCGHVETWVEPFKSKMFAALHAWLDPVKRKGANSAAVE